MFFIDVCRIHFKGKARRGLYINLPDGVCEEEGISIGGVLFCPGEQPRCFGAMIPPALVGEWASKLGQTQVIGQAELFPSIVARLTWARFLQRKRVVFFKDNESARLALVKAYSPVLASLRIVVQCIEWDFQNGCTPWYARVPTCCNVADGPSRMRMDGYLATLKPVIDRPLFPGSVPPDVVLS